MFIGLGVPFFVITRINHAIFSPVDEDIYRQALAGITQCAI